MQCIHASVKSIFLCLQLPLEKNVNILYTITNINIHIIMKYTLGLLIALLPVSVSAVEIDYLLNDIEDLDEKITTIEQEYKRVVDDARFEEHTDLFPRGRGFDDNDDELLRTDSVSDTNVYVRVDGKPTVLKDVELTSWYGPYVRDVAEANIVTGYKDASGQLTGLFGPADSITLAQLAKIALLASGTPVAECPKSALNELAQDTWADSYIACAELLRWSAFVDTTRDPNQTASRAEVAVTIMEAFERTYLPATGDIFTDVSTTYLYRDPIETAFRDGIITGYKDEDGKATNLFGPENAINRAEVAKIVSLAMQIYGQ